MGHFDKNGWNYDPAPDFAQRPLRGAHAAAGRWLRGAARFALVMALLAAVGGAVVAIAASSWYVAGRAIGAGVKCATKAGVR